MQVSLEHMNFALPGKKDLGTWNQIKDLEMGSLSWVGLPVITSVLRRELREIRQKSLSDAATSQARPAATWAGRGQKWIFL